jgi:hypothetical protein
MTSFTVSLLPDHLKNLKTDAQRSSIVCGFYTISGKRNLQKEIVIPKRNDVLK